jgi:putative peptidoglycan lipid II flippase
MQKGFWCLALILTFSTVVGVILSDEIVKLLFQRGAFSQVDTKNTSLILQAYLAGLVIYGLNKLFSLWLYAKQQQLQAAKIATYSLSTNIILSLVLIYPFEAFGLALASSLSGLVGFILTLKAFGVKRFLEFLNAKFLVILIASTTILAIITIYLKPFIKQLL